MRCLEKSLRVIHMIIRCLNLEYTYLEIAVNLNIWPVRRSGSTRMTQVDKSPVAAEWLDLSTADAWNIRPEYRFSNQAGGQNGRGHLLDEIS